MTVLDEGTADNPIILEDDALASHDASPSLKAFRLLDLPPELWIRIGKFAVNNTPPIAVRSRRGYPPSRRQLPEQPGIARVCRRLRAELLPFYYRTRINLEVIPFVSHVGQWLRNIGVENRRLVKGLRLSDQYNNGEGGTEQRLKDVWKVEFEILRAVGPGNERGRRQGLMHGVRFL